MPTVFLPKDRYQLYGKYNHKDAETGAPFLTVEGDMSGGSWDYIYMRFNDVADTLRASRNVKRHALGCLIKKIADAMHDIEWVDSCDMSPPADDEAIDKVLKFDINEACLEYLDRLNREIGNVICQIKKKD